MADVMQKEFQIQQLKRIFAALNLGVDEQEIDFEHYVDSELSLPENIQGMRTRYPQFRWSREDILEEQQNPEIRRMRESESEIRRIRKQREEAFSTIRETEKDVRNVVKQEMDKEIENLRKQLTHLIAESDRIATASPEEVDVMRKDVERIDQRIHEMDILLTDTYKKLRSMEKAKPAAAQPVETISPMRRKCVGEIVTGYEKTGEKDMWGKDVMRIVRPTMHKRSLRREPRTRIQIPTATRQVASSRPWAGSKDPESLPILPGTAVWEHCRRNGLRRRAERSNLRPDDYCRRDKNQRLHRFL